LFIHSINVLCKVSQEDEVEEVECEIGCVGRNGDNMLSTIFRAKEAPVPKLNPSIILLKKDGVLGIEDDVEDGLEGDVVDLLFVEGDEV